MTVEGVAPFASLTASVLANQAMHVVETRVARGDPSDCHPDSRATAADPRARASTTARPWKIPRRRSPGWGSRCVRRRWWDV